MSEANKYVKLSLKAMINKEKSKVLFAEADCYFVDILLSFLTLPLGRIIKILEKHYGEGTPTVGSLSSLYQGLANLGSSHFVTEGAKNTLLNPTSSFDNNYKNVFRKLKLDISDSPPAESFYCTKCNLNTFPSESVFYDNVTYCHKCKLNNSMSKKADDSRLFFACSSIPGASFIIFDDLHILPTDTDGLLRISSFLVTTEIDEAEAIQVDLGFNQVMDLLRASLTSQTPLSDVILNKATQMRNSAIVASQPNTISLPQPQIANEENLNRRNFTLKVIVQKSTGKFLYAEATKEFVEFLCSFLYIPFGGVEHLVAGKTCIKALDNLYRSAIDLKHEYYHNFLYAIGKLVQPNLPHGYMPKDHILPLTEECLSAHYSDLSVFYSAKFPLGQGSYLSGSGIYQMKDDLTVVPFSILSILPSLGEQKIPISDVKEMELKIGSKEALKILKASLTSTSALSDALLKNNTFKKRLKREV